LPTTLRFANVFGVPKEVETPTQLVSDEVGVALAVGVGVAVLEEVVKFTVADPPLDAEDQPAPDRT
jgi:hypothetical protein